MPNSSPKLAVFEQLAKVAKALGHSCRLAILEHLAQGERSVDVLAQLTGVSLANTSQHLKLLRAAGLVRSRKDGKYLVCRLSDDSVIELLSALRHTGERHVAEIEKVVSSYFQKRDSMEAVSRRELLRRMEEETITVLDVRPEDEFEMAHIPGAINIPVNQLSKRLSELLPDQEIVAYCRGPYCVFAFEAVAMLRKKGFKAKRLEDGYPEWKAKGLPVEGNAAGT
jgi:rhodanese-related sulfurtransferase/DNA-binding transcriptional ArsR family regulator